MSWPARRAIIGPAQATRRPISLHQEHRRDRKSPVFPFGRHRPCLRLAARSVRGGFSALLAAQERVDGAAIDKIKAEGLDRSQVMETASWLTDVFGARLTGSPNIRSAGEWAAKRLTEWGMVNATLEPWGYFGRGWTNDHLSAHVVSPTPFAVIAYAAAWTPGTNGT